MRSIDNRIEIAQKSLESLRQQRAAADTISAAITASRAARTRDANHAKQLDQEALNSYRSVLQLPCHKRDVVAKEGEAFHLLRLGHFKQAAIAYRRLEHFANDLVDEKQRTFTKSRALRARALILQAETLGGRTAAYDLVTYTLNNTAVSIREPYQPMRGWDAIEHADIAYAGALFSSRLRRNIVEAGHLSIARENYQRVLDANSSTFARFSNARRQLRKAALGRHRARETRPRR